MLKCSGVLGDITSQMKTLTDQLTASFGSLSCPELSGLSTDQFEQFPGYTDLNCKTGGY